MNKWIWTACVVMAAAGCSTANRNIYNAEMAAAAASDAAMRGYACYWKAATNNPGAFGRTLDGLTRERHAVEAMSVKAGSSLEMVEMLRQSYRTNSAVKPTLEAALATAGAAASNLMWFTATMFQTPQTP